ncbi:MAG: O-antigen ligase family protein, partial [Flavobacteriales bacterium]|nr:O-antigen ligase family protein [Flavobacteriales bacterium]
IVLSMALGLAGAWTCWAGTGAASCFAQSALSYELHPSYAAWYACWALAWWGHRLIMGRVAKARGVVASLLVLLLVWTMMLASKSGVIGLAMVVGLLLVVLLRRAKGRGRWWALGGAAAAMLVAAWAQGPLVMLRMQAAVHAVERAAKGDPAVMSSADGNDLRLVAWACSIDRLRHAPLGAGTGDIKHALMDCYHERGAEQAAMRNLNSHSQFLQGAVALGWPGLVLTVLLALVPIVCAWRRRHLPMLAFMGLFVVNAAVESVLEVQAGVVFFALFLGLLAAGTDLRPNRPRP